MLRNLSFIVLCKKKKESLTVDKLCHKNVRNAFSETDLIKDHFMRLSAFRALFRAIRERRNRGRSNLVEGNKNPVGRNIGRRVFTEKGIKISIKRIEPLKRFFFSFFQIRRKYLEVMLLDNQSFFNNRFYKKELKNNSPKGKKTVEQKQGKEPNKIKM